MPGSATPPLNRLYPNQDAAIEDGVPLISTILFGFSGTYFATATTLPAKKLTLNIPHTFGWLHCVVDQGATVLTITAIACFCFYVSFRAAIYAKMHNTEKLSAANSSVRTPADVEMVAHNKFFRDRQLARSLLFFNIGVLLLPFAVLIFLPEKWASIPLFLYSLVLLYYIVTEALQVFWRIKNGRIELLKTYPNALKRRGWLRR